MDGVAKYSVVRGAIADGDLIGFAGRSNWLPGGKGSFQSWAIRWWTGPSWKPWKLAEVSHVGVCIWVTTQWDVSPRLFVMEAVGSGVRMLPLGWLVEHYPGAIYHRPLKGGLISGQTVAANGLAKLGRSYAPLSQYAVIALPWFRRLLYRLGWKTDLGPEQEVCSEFVAREFIEAGFQAGKPAEETSPAEVWQWPIFGNATTLKAG